MPHGNGDQAIGGLCGAARLGQTAYDARISDVYSNGKNTFLQREAAQVGSLDKILYTAVTDGTAWYCPLKLISGNGRHIYAREAGAATLAKIQGHAGKSRVIDYVRCYGYVLIGLTTSDSTVRDEWWNVDSEGIQ